MNDYNSSLFGPFFAVSDEGSAGNAIVEAAYASAKVTAFPCINPLRLGVILDGERMTSAGEVPIGPDEYEMLLGSARDRVLCTTNVGVRVNTRLLQPLPEFPITDLLTDDGIEKLLATFHPFLQTLDRRPRPLTVRIILRTDSPFEKLQSVIDVIEAARKKGRIGPRDVHRLALLIDFEKPIDSESQFTTIERVVDAAAAVEVNEVALDGELRPAARRRIALQALLNVVDACSLRRLLKYAHSKRVALKYRYQLDIESAARTVWTGLHAARTNGFAAGKYGLVPMTLDEQRTAIELITRWSDSWTAIPAFYVDTPLVTHDDVYEASRSAEGALLWLKMARSAGATLVLFDCPDRIAPKRLLRQDGTQNDPGILSLTDVERIMAYASDLGVKILWSGGITAPQAFELARRHVFGIFSTSSTATKIAVTADFERDPRLPAENEPTEFGVRRIHAVIQGGFLSAALDKKDASLAATIENKTKQLLAADSDVGKTCSALKALNLELVRGWSSLIESPAITHQSHHLTIRTSLPVPADAVRVFRGIKQSGLSYNDLLRSLESTFMPMTVQMQRLFGLTAYLPAVLPPGHGEGVPDEVALVFYRTQSAYSEAKRCVGGRAYGDLHSLVFDMKASQSGFPQLFAGSVKTDQPYHLFETSIDWQTGATRLTVDRVRKGIDASNLFSRVAAEATTLKSSRTSLDAVIFCVTSSCILWWEHAAADIPVANRFADVADTVFSGSPRFVRTPISITSPYSGITLQDSGDFVSMQFLRLNERTTS